MMKLTHTNWLENNWLNFSERRFGYCFTSCIQSLVNFALFIGHKFEQIIVNTSSTVLLLTDNVQEWHWNEMAFNDHRRRIPKRTWRRHSAMLSLMQQQNIHSK